MTQLYLVTTSMKNFMSMMMLLIARHQYWVQSSHPHHIMRTFTQEARLQDLWPPLPMWLMIFSGRHNEVVNQGASVSSKGRPSSSQCDSGNRMSALLASSAHLIEVPREYEIPVHSNSAYEIRDTLNDYEN